MKIFCFIADLLWFLLSRRLMIVVLVVLMFAFFRYDITGWFWPRDTKRNPAPSSRLVDDAAGEAARSIVLQCPQPENTYSQLLVLPVRNDREYAIENMIRREFQQQADSGWYKLVEKDVVTQTLDQLQLLTFGKDGQKELTEDDAIRLGKAAGAELVLLSQVDRFVPAGGGHEIRGTSQLINVSTGETLVIPFDNFAENGMTKHSGTLGQFVVLVIFTLVWPILMIPVLRGVVARENNRDNLVTMVIMAAIPLGIVLLWVGTLPTTAFALMGCCIFFALAAGWTGFVMDKLAEKK
ncbi:MAG: hypothetical protein FWD31_06740 [Planctomycetaceae bacterium]|nr:hypothetical protein [Planctomycetaceae bacterium]